MQLRVSERSAAGMVFYRVDGGEKLTGVTDGVLEPLPPIRRPPTPDPGGADGGSEDLPVGSSGSKKIDVRISPAGNGRHLARGRA